MKVKTSRIGLCNVSIGYEEVDLTQTVNLTMLVARIEIPVAQAIKHRALLPFERLCISTGLNDWDVERLEEHLDDSAFGSEAVCFIHHRAAVADALPSDREAIWAAHAGMLVKAMELMLAEAQVSISVIEAV